MSARELEGATPAALLEAAEACRRQAKAANERARTHQQKASEELALSGEHLDQAEALTARAAGLLGELEP